MKPSETRSRLTLDELKSRLARSGIMYIVTEDVRVVTKDPEPGLLEPDAEGLYEVSCLEGEQ